MKTIVHLITFLFLFLSLACVSNERKSGDSSAPYSSPSSTTTVEQLNSRTEAAEEEIEIPENSCGPDNGTYSSTVQYHNSRTNYSATYTLDVDVENCMVTVIRFPNGGWLDSDHIEPSELNEDGFARIQGEGGKSYEVHISP